MKILRKSFISCFIIIVFLTMLRTHMSFDSAVVRMIYSRVDPALSFLSFYQDWMMFAPNPTRMNSEVYAEVEFESGELIKYHFDSPTKLSHLEKYLGGEKIRKYFQETIGNTSNRFAHKDLARYVLRQLRQSHSEKIPLRVKLVQSKNFIPAPEVEFRKSSETKLKYNDEILFIHEVI